MTPTKNQRGGDYQGREGLLTLRLEKPSRALESKASKL